MMVRASQWSCTACGAAKPRRQLNFLPDGRVLCEACFRHLPRTLQIRLRKP